MVDKLSDTEQLIKDIFQVGNVLNISGLPILIKAVNIKNLSTANISLKVQLVEEKAQKATKVE